jgi:hypothetical protein
LAANYVHAHAKKVRKKLIGAEAVNENPNVPDMAPHRTLDPDGFYHTIQTVPGEAVDSSKGGAPHVLIAIVSTSTVALRVFWLPCMNCVNSVSLSDLAVIVISVWL